MGTIIGKMNSRIRFMIVNYFQAFKKLFIYAAGHGPQITPFFSLKYTNLP